MPNDKTKKDKPETPASDKAAPAANKAPEMTLEDYRDLLTKHGARFCPDCEGIGLVRETEGQPRVKCSKCHGTGSVPCPEGELEVFICNPPVLDAYAVDLDQSVTTPGWQRFPAKREYRYMVPGSGLPRAIVTEAEIDRCDGVEGMRALVAEKVGA